jgi:hypothetical protein
MSWILAECITRLALPKLSDIQALLIGCAKLASWSSSVNVEHVFGLPNTSYVARTGFCAASCRTKVGKAVNNRSSSRRFLLYTGL